jgi:hypothetical protein
MSWTKLSIWRGANWRGRAEFQSREKKEGRGNGGMELHRYMSMAIIGGLGDRIHKCHLELT